MDNEKIRQRMQKLLALARRGDGGEKENAQRFLDRMLKEHGMTMADLDDEVEPTQVFEFKYRGNLEKRLLFQVVFTVLQVGSLKYGQHKTSIIMEMTRAQHLEVQMAFDIYRRELENKVDQLFLAFIHKNQLFGLQKDKDQGGGRQLSEKEAADIRAMMNGIDQTTVRRAITHDCA